MKKRLNRFNLLQLAVALGVLTAFHRDIIRILRDNSVQNLAENIIFAFFIAVFLLILVRSRVWERRDSAAVYLLIFGVLSYFYFTGPLLLFKLQLVEFFVAGMLLLRLFIRSGTFIPVLFIIFLAFFVEVIDNIVAGSDIYFLNILKNLVTGIGGFISGSLFFGRR